MDTIDRLVRMLDEAISVNVNLRADLEGRDREIERHERNAKFLNAEWENSQAAVREYGKQIDTLNREIYSLKLEKKFRLIEQINPTELLDELLPNDRQKIPLIKAVRIGRDLSLKDAKDIVDAWEHSGAIYWMEADSERQYRQLTTDEIERRHNQAVFSDEHDDHDPMDHGQFDEDRGTGPDAYPPILRDSYGRPTDVG